MSCAGVPKQLSPVTRQVADRELHALFTKGSDAHSPLDDAWTDMRRKRSRFWGNLLRRVDQLVDWGVDPRLILMIPMVLEAYIRERLIERDSLRPAA